MDDDMDDYERDPGALMDCPRCNGLGEKLVGLFMEPCKWCDEGKVEPCCVCGKASQTYYDDRPDCPSCGSPHCELRMQWAADYHDERGG